MKQNSGHIYWITGLSGSGKTTLATALHKALPGSLLLDGDAMREVLGTGSSAFDRAGRLSHAFVYARLCRLLAGQGVTVIMATISLFSEIHTWNRGHLLNYREIFLDVPEEIRRQRDPKGLYAKEKAGLVSDMAGLELAIDFPLASDLTFDHTFPVDTMVQRIVEYS